MSEPRVLVVEDEADVRRHLVRALEREGMMVDQAADGEEGLRLFEQELHPVVLLDLRMPKLDGMAVLERIRHQRPETQVVILSGHGTMKDAVRALNLHAAAYLEKPPDLEALVAALRQAWTGYLDRVGLSEEGMVGDAPLELSEVRRILQRVPASALHDKNRGAT